MKEFVQNILIYVIIIAVLRGLITGPKYQQYFQFFSGVVLILLFLTPVLSFFQSDRDWYHILEEKLMQMDLAEIRGEMKVAEEGFDQVLRRRYEEAVREQVGFMAREQGIQLEDTEVILEKREDAWEVTEVSGKIAGKEGDFSEKNTREDREKNSMEKAAVEAVTIGEEPMGEKKEDTSPRGRALRKQICSSFTLGKEQVHLWK